MNLPSNYFQNLHFENFQTLELDFVAAIGSLPKTTYLYLYEVIMLNEKLTITNIDDKSK